VTTFGGHSICHEGTGWWDVRLVEADGDVQIWRDRYRPAEGEPYFSRYGAGHDRVIVPELPAWPWHRRLSHFEVVRGEDTVEDHGEPQPPMQAPAWSGIAMPDARIEPIPTSPPHQQAHVAESEEAPILVVREGTEWRASPPVDLLDAPELPAQIAERASGAIARWQWAVALPADFGTARWMALRSIDLVPEDETPVGTPTGAAYLDFFRVDDMRLELAGTIPIAIVRFREAMPAVMRTRPHWGVTRALHQAEIAGPGCVRVSRLAQESATLTLDPSLRRVVDEGAPASMANARSEDDVSGTWRIGDEGATPGDCVP
jgi:hypothetical protein